MTRPRELKRGDEVSWNYGAGQPTGTVEEVVNNTASIITKNGNTVSRKGDESNPAVKLKSSSGTNVLKKASELNGVEVEDNSQVSDSPKEERNNKPKKQDSKKEKTEEDSQKIETSSDDDDYKSSTDAKKIEKVESKDDEKASGGSGKEARSNGTEDEKVEMDGKEVKEDVAASSSTRTKRNIDEVEKEGPTRIQPNRAVKSDEKIIEVDADVVVEDEGDKDREPTTKRVKGADV